MGELENKERDDEYCRKAAILRFSIIQKKILKFSNS